MPPAEDDTYLLAEQDAELDRLLLQSHVWEPSGRQLLARLGSGTGARVVDLGCGTLGWLRILSDWVGPTGQVVGTDIDENLLAVARSALDTQGITNVHLERDDLFTSTLEPASFDLVHARYLIAPLARGREQSAIYRSLVRPGGWLVCEEWNAGSWHYNPPAPAAERPIELICDVFTQLGGEAGQHLPQLLRDNGITDFDVDAHLVALEPGHPYLRLPLQCSAFTGTPPSPVRECGRPRGPPPRGRTGARRPGEVALAPSGASWFERCTPQSHGKQMSRSRGIGSR